MLRLVGRSWPLVAVAFACALAPALAGPPYVTDDPDPTPYRHWEIYSGATYDNGLEGWTSALPFVEFNYGALPNVQVSTTLPLSLEGGSGSEAFRFGDFDFGVKLRFVQESSRRPMVSFYPSISVPSAAGAHARSFLPLWAQKSSGPWTAFGGGGLYLDSGGNRRNSTFLGGALERDLSSATTLGAEVYRQGVQSNGAHSLTGFNIGLISTIGNQHAILFSVGRALQSSQSISAYGAYEFRLGPTGSGSK